MEKYKTTFRKILKNKNNRRKKLAQLSIEKKVKILLELQKLAAPIYKSRGIDRKPWVFPTHR